MPTGHGTGLAACRWAIASNSAHQSATLFLDVDGGARADRNRIRAQATSAVTKNIVGSLRRTTGELTSNLRCLPLEGNAASVGRPNLGALTPIGAATGGGCKEVS